MRDILLVLLAVLPALWLFRRARDLDRLESEPVELLRGLFLAGAVGVTGASMLMEVALEAALKELHLQGTGWFVLRYMVVVALTEEGLKYLALRLITWKRPAFNCLYDAMVYAMAVSMGMAATENVLYVLSYGWQTGILRALLSLPAHASFAVYMGLWYGRARRACNAEQYHACARAQCLALLIPALLHGTYDLCVSGAVGLSPMSFLALTALMFFFARRTLRRTAEMDHVISA